MLRRLFASLKFRLALAGVLALAAGIGIPTAMLLDRARTDTMAAQRQQDSRDTARGAQWLAHSLATQQRALALAAAQWGDTPMDDAHRVHAFVASKPVLLAQFDRVFVTEGSGRATVTHGRDGRSLNNAQLSDVGFLARVLESGQAAISAPMSLGSTRTGSEGLSSAPTPTAAAADASDNMVIVLAQPLRQDGKVRGVLAGLLRLQSQDLLAGVAGLSEKTQRGGADDAALVVVTDANGLVLGHPDGQRVGSSLGNEPRLADAHGRWRRDGMPLSPEGMRYDNDTELATAATVPGAGWVVWRTRPWAEVLAPLAAGRQQALAWAAALVVAFTLGLLLLLGWLLRPMARLQARAEHLLDDAQLADAGWPQAVGEIGELERVLRQTATTRAELEQANRQTLQRLQSVMAAAPVGLAISRAQKFELASATFCQLLGRDEAALLGQPAQIIFASNEDYLRLGPAVGAAFSQSKSYDGEWQMLRADGQRFWGRLRGQPVAWGDAGAGTIWTLTDISNELRAREALQWSASHDALTGLINRQGLEQRLARWFDSSAEGRPAAMAPAEGRPAALVLFDLDHFKPINDEHGHAAGDAMLRAVGQAAAACLRGSDVLVRLGGDEFAILIERCPPEISARLAEAVRAAIEAIRLPWHSATLQCGASVGVAEWTEAITTPEQWLAAADQACYAAKAAGRGAVRFAGNRPLRLVSCS